MKKLFASIITVATLLAAAMCINTTVFADYSYTMDVSNMKIQWSDEFTGNTLNTDYWTCQLGNGNAYGVWEWGNNEKQYYTSREQNVSVSNGVLNITARYEPSYNGTNYNYTSARIRTADKVTVGNGYVEARIKVPSVRGVWPAFWMLGTNGENWPDCGEIDILETWNTNTFVQSTIHYSKTPGVDTYEYRQRNGVDKTEWHTYGVYRDDTTLTFYVDRTALGTWDITSDEMAELRDEYYLLLNMACGGNLAGGALPSASDLPATMQVDYVRYYVNKTAEELAAENQQNTNTTTAVTTTTETGVTKPGRAVIKSLKNVKKNKMKITLKKMKSVTGYQIRYCVNKKFQGYTTKNTKKRNVTIKKLKKNKTYYVKARAYKKVNGMKTYGKWSKVKKVKIKK